MKKYFIIIFCITFLQPLVAQEAYNVNNLMIKVNLLRPGMTFEKGISKNTTVCLDASLIFGFSFSTSMMNGTDFGLSVGPLFRAQYRYYYNFEKRKIKGKNSLNNSGNFFAASSGYSFKPVNFLRDDNRSDNLTVGGVWGFQRTYKSNVNISANFGVGYNFSENVKSNIVPIINFSVGWVIFK
jgi:hypothetical protein